MSRVKAVELVAYGISCDYAGCEVLIPTRNASSTPPGYYVKTMRVTDSGYRTTSGEEWLFFCTKEHMLEELHSFSSVNTEVIGREPKP